MMTDPNNWTKSFVLQNTSACISFLVETNNRIISLLNDKNYAAAIAGIDRVTNGMLTMQNAGCGNFSSHIATMSYAEGMILAFAEIELDGKMATDADKRKTAIAAFEDARDFASSENLRNAAQAFVKILKSEKALSTIAHEQEINLPYDAVNAIGTVNSNLATSNNGYASSGLTPKSIKMIIGALCILGVIGIIVFIAMGLNNNAKKKDSVGGSSDDKIVIVQESATLTEDRALELARLDERVVILNEYFKYKGMLNDKFYDFDNTDEYGVKYYFVDGINTYDDLEKALNQDFTDKRTKQIIEQQKEKGYVVIKDGKMYFPSVVGDMAPRESETVRIENVSGNEYVVYYTLHWQSDITYKLQMFYQDGRFKVGESEKIKPDKNIMINEDIFDDFGLSYAELSQKYGEEIERSGANGGVHIKFKNSKFWYCLDEKDSCFYITCKAEDFLIGYDLPITVFDLAKGGKLGISSDENIADGKAYVHTVDNYIYYYSIWIYSDSMDVIDENSYVHIKVKD